MNTFRDLFVSGRLSAEAIDDYIDSWHQGESEQSLPSYLGMTPEQYALWINDPDYLTKAIGEKNPQS